MSQPPLAAIVLAAGQSVRMRSATPKVLHEVLGEPIVGLVVDATRAAGADPIVVVVAPGEPGDAVRRVLEARAEKAGVEAPRFVVQQEARGTADALLAARSALKGFEGRSLLLAGDAPLLRTETLMALHAEHLRAQAWLTLLTMELDQPKGYGRIIRADGEGDSNQPTAIVEEKSADAAQREIREVNSGVYVLELPAAFDEVAAIGADSRSGEHYVTDLVGRAAAAGRKLAAVRADDPDECLGINTRRDLVRVLAVARDRVIGQLLDSGVTVVDPATTWIDARAKIGQDTIIEPFTVITGKVVIGSGCRVGPFTQLRAGTVLDDGAEVGNFVEVKNTTLGAGTKAKHLAYLGDGQIGAGANIGAGTVFANYDGESKHETRVGDGAFVGSGTIFVAPSQLGAGAKTGAGAVVKRGTEIPDGAVWVGVPAHPIHHNGDKP